MATSGTYSFSMDIMEIIEEAFERCQKEIRGSYELDTARRSIELLLTDWANDQVNLWTLELDTLAVTSTSETYTISSPAIDVLDGVLRLSDNTDIPMERISLEEYLNRPTKTTTTGRPTHYAILRGDADLTLYLWPKPDQAYTFVYYSLNFIQDAVGSSSTGYTNTLDIPRRFLPAFISGLAVKIAEKNIAKQTRAEDGTFQVGEGVTLSQLQDMRGTYLAEYSKAKHEDRDRASIYITPKRRRW